VNSLALARKLARIYRMAGYLTDDVSALPYGRGHRFFVRRDDFESGNPIVGAVDVEEDHRVDFGSDRAFARDLVTRIRSTSSDGRSLRTPST
jgi:hypothetical protein